MSFRRQSVLAEYGTQGSGFDPTVYRQREMQPRATAHDVPVASSTQGHYQQSATQAYGGATQRSAHHQPGQHQQQQQQQPRTAPSSRGSQTRPLRNLTARQLVARSHCVGGELGSCILVDGAEIGLVRIVGRIVEKTAAAAGGDPTAEVLLVSDGTGVVAAQNYAGTTHQSGLQPAIGDFVAVTGRVVAPSGGSATQGGGHWRIVGQVVLEPDANHFTYHLLDALLTSLRLTRGDHLPPSASQPGPKKATAPTVMVAQQQSSRAAAGAGPAQTPMGQAAPLRHTAATLGAAATAQVPVPRAAPPASAPVPTVHLRHLRPADAPSVALTAPGVNPDIGLTGTEIADRTVDAVAETLHMSRDKARDAIVDEVHRLVASGELCATIDEQHFALP